MTTCLSNLSFLFYYYCHTREVKKADVTSIWSAPPWILKVSQGSNINLNPIVPVLTALGT